MRPRVGVWLAAMLLWGGVLCADWVVPIRSADPHSWRDMRLTAIGAFGIWRVARPSIPAHLHAGIDIRRPRANYGDEPIFPAAAGRVVSVRDDGPYSQIIVVHEGQTPSVWTAYEHVAGILCRVGEWVEPQRAIARFMTRRELDRWGWQFDHLHFEILRLAPIPMLPTVRLPQRFFRTHNLLCYSRADLNRYYHDPRAFLHARWARH